MKGCPDTLLPGYSIRYEEMIPGDCLSGVIVP